MTKIKNFFKKNKIVKWICVILALIACCACITSIVGILNKEHNPDNLIDVKSENYILSQDTARGVKVKVDDDGIIYLSGKATSPGSLVVATVELEPGKYPLSGVDNPNVDQFGIYITTAEGDSAFANTEDDTLEVTQKQTVSVILYWCNEYNFNVFTNCKVEPVLVAGTEAGDFFK